METNHNAILLVGNGINRAFEKSKENFIPTKVNWDLKGLSWKNIIEQMLFNYNSDLKYEDISKYPMPMQIIMASQDSVNEAMKRLSENLVEEIISDEKSKLCKKLLGLPVDDILTTNYTYELEQAAGILPEKSSYYRARKHTKENATETEKKSRLYTYSDLTSISKKVWHIHGDVTSPETVVMGHYWYCKLLKKIEDRAAYFIMLNNIRKGKFSAGFKYSWVDKFLKNDVYMLGFGFDTSEIDLWYLAWCKKRNFKNTKIHYYTSSEKLDKGFESLLESCGVEIHQDVILKNENYAEYYYNAIEDIREKLKEDEKNEN